MSSSVDSTNSYIGLRMQSVYANASIIDSGQRVIEKVHEHESFCHTPR
jgi:hypothetical protein